MRYFKITRIHSVIEEVEDIYVHFLLVTSTLSYLFLLNYAGQDIMDYNNDIFLTL